jgi:hypothetical protein
MYPANSFRSTVESSLVERYEVKFILRKILSVPQYEATNIQRISRRRIF